MNFPNAQLYEYRLPLARPVTSGEDAAFREGLILHLQDEQGHQGFGEIAPLPGYSREDLYLAKKDVAALLQRVRDEELPAGLEKCSGQFRKLYGEHVPCASVRNGFESAILTFMAARRHESPAALLFGPQHQTQLSLNALLTGPADQINADADARLAEGYHAMKIKVGRESWQDDAALLKDLSRRMGDRVLLRLDANQRWDAATATRFGQALGPAVIDYIEEPFAEQGAIPDFYHQTFIPVALDESLRGMSWPQISAVEGVDVLIIKPMMLGGIEESLQLIRQARDRGVKTVVSSTFESSIGLHVLAQLAAGCSRHTAVGLDTWRWFEADIGGHPGANFAGGGHWSLPKEFPRFQLEPTPYLRPVS